MNHDPAEDGTAPADRPPDAEGHEDVEPANLRFLRRLVTVLTATMIVGILGIVGLMFLRLPAMRAPVPTETLSLPETIVLPEGARATAFTQGRDWFAVVTEDDLILIYDRASGALRQTVRIER